MPGITKQLQFELLFHNAFGSPPSEIGYTVEYSDDQYRAVKNGRAVTLRTNGDDAVGWEVDGQPLMPFKLLGRRDRQAENNYTRLEHRVGGGVRVEDMGQQRVEGGSNENPPVEIRAG